ncbi:MULTISPECIES: ferredoxin [Rhodococcus]|uniref:Ferredoxin n=2 Tax=Nocardiaceae TaxID=85025 RepID=A0A652YH31_NOCGL|nr:MULTISPECIES: ferredoxin [Rhodococcus]MDV6271270.1 ferredoxin [Rhodococcus globerulus]MDV8071444.1 ferredoxin [Rhodococcus sp. IEGM 1366]PVX63417.1 ferredoxin [Rhodococcus globerulus]QXW05209.1 ferredoxin [Rhodococcus globerulus]
MISGELTIDRDRCMGSGQCTFYAPATFDLDEMSIAVVIDDHGDDHDNIQQAIDVCPTRSIVRAAGAEGVDTQ